MAPIAKPYLDRIDQDPEIMVGKPVIKGTRIPVSTVLAQLAGNPDLEELFAAYPRLTIEDVKAALAFAGDSVDSRTRQKAKSTRRSAVPAQV